MLNTTISMLKLKQWLKISPNATDVTIFQSDSGEHFLFQVRCKDVDFDKHDFGYFINQTKQNTFENNRIGKFIKLAKISSSEIDEFISCYNESLHS